MQRHDPDAADSAGARQDDAVSLAGECIACRQRMFSDKGVDGFLRPGGADAIRQIESPGDLAAKAVDVQRDTANARISQRGLKLGGDAFVGREARGLPEARWAMPASGSGSAMWEIKSAREGCPPGAILR